VVPADADGDPRAVVERENGGVVEVGGESVGERIGVGKIDLFLDLKKNSY
jgi:hypothetical protein